MIVSLNEIESAMLKAARGAGYSWGLAEEAGAAARWLALWDLPWQTTAPTLLSSEAIAATVSDQTVCNPLLAGLAFADHVHSEGDASVNFPAVFAPLWSVGVLACGAGPRASQLDRSQPLEITWPLARVVLQRGVARSAEGALDAELSGLTLKTITLVLTDTRLPDVAKPGERFVSDALWHELTRLGARTYVPASQQSRKTGAGAGTGDSD